MKIKSIRMKNFRSFKDCEVEFGNFTSLVGANGAGKSTVLYALNIFFREVDGSPTNVSELDEEDFHARNTQEPIEITVTFDELSDDALKVFSNYARQGVLVVTAKASFDPQARTAVVRQFGQRFGMEKFRRFFEMYGDSKPAAELRSEYNQLCIEFQDLPSVNSKDACRDALQSYESIHPDQCNLIPSEDQFYGVSKGSNRLAQFIQWVYLPAVKDAAKEKEEGKNTALGKILARTVRTKIDFDSGIEKIRDETIEKYRQLIGTQQSVLDDISATLTTRLKEWAHPEAKARLAWKEESKKTVQIEDPIARIFAGEGEFEGDIARFGHGLQRSYLLALLQVLANADDEDAPKLILGCEEPELYQHPPQARHLSHVLLTLSERNSQVIVSTHSPYFVVGKHFESVRLIRQDSAKKCATVSSLESKRISERIADITGEAEVPVDAQIALLHQVLQPNINEIFFAPKIVLVEGLEDMAYITSWLILNNKWDLYRRSRCHIVPANGKNHLITPLAMAQELRIPTLIVFDADGNIENSNQQQHHQRDNTALIRLLGLDDQNVFPKTSLWGESYVIWSTNLGDTFRSEVDETQWNKAYSQATKGLGSPTGSYGKNTVHIGNHLALLKKDNIDIPSLTRLCDLILGF
jgi:putative ATP-dependent endonuclease of the OLD family